MSKYNRNESWLPDRHHQAEQKTSYLDQVLAESLIVARSTRAGDADRDTYLDVLARAYAEGYLSAEELAKRQDYVLQVITKEELPKAVSDLPAEILAPASEPVKTFKRGDRPLGDFTLAQALKPAARLLLLILPYLLIVTPSLVVFQVYGWDPPSSHGQGTGAAVAGGYILWIIGWFAWSAWLNELREKKNRARLLNELREKRNRT